jgi:hypothetical protein
MWGQLDDGQASAQPRQTTLFSALARLFADSGVPPGVDLDRADAALGPEDTLTARRAPCFITRFPAT